MRRRPLVPYSKPAPIVDSPTARRIIVTRVRSRGPANQLLTTPDDGYFPAVPDTFPPTNPTRHRVTVTRRRKIQPTFISETSARPRVTRKKLVNVRPVVQPTPTFAIITTGFYSAPSTPNDDEYEYEDDQPEDSVDERFPAGEKIDEPKTIVNSEQTPNLKNNPNEIDSKPEQDFDDGGNDEPSKYELDVPEKPTKVDSGPIIITDHFFFPATETEDDEDEYSETTTENYKTTVSVMTEESPITTERENSTEIAEETTEETEEYTKAPVTSTPNADDSKLINGSLTSTNGPLTETAIKEDTTTTESPPPETESPSHETESPPPETTSKPITIYIEEEKSETIPETTAKPLTIFIEQEKINLPITTEEVPVETEVPEEEEITTIGVTDKPIIESEILDTTTEHPVTEAEDSTTLTPIEPEEDDLSVVPLESYYKFLESSTKSSSKTFNIKPSSTWSPAARKTKKPYLKNSFAINESDALSVIPLEDDPTSVLPEIKSTLSSATFTTSYASPTPEDIEAGLTDELYLSLSRPDFPQIAPSIPIDNVYNTNLPSGNVVPTPELRTSVYYTETVVTSTKLRTYTYVVTKLNGLETEVTSSTTVRPRVTTLTLTVPVTMTISLTLESPRHNSVAPVHNPVPVAGEYFLDRLTSA